MTENPSVQPNPPQNEDSVEEIRDFCGKLLASLHLDLTLDAKVEDGSIELNLTGRDRPFLLSNSAALLNSLEFLLNRIFHSKKDESPGIILDSDSYRQHRKAELTLLAQMASKKVLSSGRPLDLQPMTPRERRIVHLVLTEIEGVHSQSKGEGENRSITIYPS